MASFGGSDTASIIGSAIPSYYQGSNPWVCQSGGGWTHMQPITLSTRYKREGIRFVKLGRFKNPQNCRGEKWLWHVWYFPKAILLSESPYLQCNISTFDKALCSSRFRWDLCACGSEFFPCPIQTTFILFPNLPIPLSHCFVLHCFNLTLQR